MKFYQALAVLVLLAVPIVAVACLFYYHCSFYWCLLSLLWGFAIFIDAVPKIIGLVEFNEA